MIDCQKFAAILLNLTNNHKLPQLSLHSFEQIPSTNQILWELLEEGIKLPIVAIADQQTAGRGQWGRQWQSPLGGLYLSIALNMDISAANTPHLTLFSAVGIANALRSHHIPLLLKWPNDLILQGYKLGGIKSETRLQQGQIKQAIIGVGINWTNSVPQMGINLQSFLQDQSQPAITSLEMLAALTTYGILSAYQTYLANGIEALLPSYLELLSSRGQQITVNGSPGVVVGVTATGELRVRLHSEGASTEISLPPGAISLGYGE